MEDTVVTLITISTLFIPLIAIMLGHATISGETEKGALSLVLAYPVNRVEVLFGKFIGLGSVLVVSTVAGFGIGGVIIAATVNAESGVAYLAFIGLTVLLGFLYLSLSICFSSICKKRSTSIGAGIVIFFWSMIIGFILMGIYLATGGSYADLFVTTVDLPDWFWACIVLSPMDMNQMSVMLAFDINMAFGVNVVVPEYMSLGLLLFVQLVWVLVPLILAFCFFERRDI
jgi:ABC-type transport system involved in multi-copper enzyme maturation permease subunit